jgi:hypothetical protein
VRRTVLPFVAAVAVALTAACGSSSKSPQAAPTGAAGASSSATPGAGAKPGASTSPGAPGSPGATAPAQGGESPGAPGVVPSGSASPTPVAYTTDGTVHPSHQATEKEIPIEAAVVPACVVPGTTARLNVTTVPRAAIAYLAVYHGEKSGAAPPWGEGYGGNDKGESNNEGKWTSSWAVSLTTPSGPARVILVVGAKGKQRKIEVPFSVGGREAGCGGT